MKKKSRFGKAMKYVTVFLIAVVVVIVVRYFASKKQVDYIPPTPAVSVMYPGVGTIKEEIVLSAHIEARAMVPVVPMVSGTILAYPVRAGNVVYKGELLAKIDQGPFEQQMLQAKAAYKGYENSFARVEGLYKAGAATRQEYDTLMSQRDAAKAQYDLAALQLSYANVTSPVTGTVIAAPMAVGSVAGAPNPIAIVADLDDLVVKLNVPEKYYPIFVRNKNELEAYVVMPDYEGGNTRLAGENTCEAEIDTIAPYIDGASKTFETIFKLKNVPIDFKPGMFVQLKVVFNKHDNVLLIPRTAKLSDGTIYTFKSDSGSNDGNESELENKEFHEDDIIPGSIESFVLEDYITDGEYLMVPEEFANTLFIVKGQNNILSGQSVNAKYEQCIIYNGKGAE